MTRWKTRRRRQQKQILIVRDALHGVATGKQKPFQPRFNKYSWSAAAKTGTAEVAGKEDMAWFILPPLTTIRSLQCAFASRKAARAVLLLPLWQGHQIMDAAIQSAAAPWKKI